VPRLDGVIGDDKILTNKDIAKMDIRKHIPKLADFHKT